ncbi:MULTISPECIES: GntR family transcriptional regulator [Microbacterium]|uniref:GntR family transcriptional regulator n=1 Tax=Microbacterium TaxID=33882 RepID=UPI001E477AB0|nr:GntR family transcriptional regulator [Microbacterium nymphoidis]MCD2499208.1 GntR family transcriptional regulator [Microbacterium nymphoidis]
MITIDPAAGTPPFEQLRVQIIDAIATGELPAGDKLPTVRRLAADLEIAPGTVARAYRELEAAGLIETRGRNGTFVRAQGDVRMQRAQDAAAGFASQIRALRLDPAEALELVKRALHV